MLNDKNGQAILLGTILLMGLAVVPAMWAPQTNDQPLTWSAAAQQVSIVEGKVLSTGEESFVVQVRRVRNCNLKGQTITVVWDEHTQWTRGKRTASPDELWVGAFVTVSGTVQNGVLYADTVQIGGGGR